jgi:hypothetical protein
MMNSPLILVLQILRFFWTAVTRCLAEVMEVNGSRPLGLLGRVGYYGVE